MGIKTIGEIAAEIGEQKERVRYAIESRGIEPVCRVGGYRVFDDAARDRVREILRGIDAKRKASALDVDELIASGDCDFDPDLEASDL